MSFLADTLGSIGGAKAPAPPIRPPSRPSSTKPQINNALTSVDKPQAAVAKPVYKGTAGTSGAASGNGLKRKAEDALLNDPAKIGRPIGQAAATDAQKVSRLTTEVSKTSISKPGDRIASPVSASAGAAPKLPIKAPAKGSYAEKLARAKEAQQSKAPSQIGIIRHQATEKTRPSKLADRKKGPPEKAPEKGKAAKAVPSPRPAAPGRIDSRRRSASPIKKGESSKVARTAKPPLNAPLQYKGTLGNKAKVPHEARRPKSSRYDEYLGTDEEDEDDDDDGDGYGRDEQDYYSDASSDMEGGFDDLEQEEAAALRAAREDDAKELALENKLKREKLERKQKLAAMASKRR